MDMPDDTPTKLYPISRNEQDQCFEQQQEQQEQEEEQNFSSFASTNKQNDGSSSSMDEHGFKKKHNYRQKLLTFPEMPSNLGKLYQIYQQNIHRKKQLKTSIQQLIQTQLKALRIAYDKQKFSIEQFIDLDEQSPQYKISKQNYEERKKQLQKLSSNYKLLKIMHVENMMMNDLSMKSILNQYVKNNKEIISVNVLNDTVTVLCKEKHNRKKNRNRSKKVEDIGKTLNQVISEDDETSHHYMIRNFRFYKTLDGVYFLPLDQPIQIGIINNEYMRILVDPLTNHYIISESKKLYDLAYNRRQQQLITLWELDFDFPIIFCERFKNYLYLGTQDGILRMYEVKQNVKPILHKIALCSHGNQYSKVTHFSLTNNPQIIIFVQQGTHLCQMNLLTYSTYLLCQLPEKILQIDQRIIITKDCYYLDYYSPAGSHGKTVLQHNEKLATQSKKGKLVKLHKYGNFQYLILAQDFGVFCMQLYK